jgi:threonyl-tRNA synthetase
MDKNLKDHKTLGKELELFFTHDYAPGAPFWLPNGMIIFKELEKYIRELTEKAGYLETSTPIMIKSQLFVESGHFAKFGEHNMYHLKIADDENDSNPVNYSLKPMNCPESTILYRFRPRSYKELPLRLAEIGRLHRKEKSGEVNGLLRVRQITMDDAHIYARESQISDEVSNILDMMATFYKSFGFEYELRFATRPDQRAGTDEMWDKAEKDLEEVLKKKKIKAGDKKGDGAFYGPKIDLHIKDALGRDWQLATVQIDFWMPSENAFDLKYVNEKGEFEKPVMIHRAIFGSFERFIGILTEHYQGAFPLWLSPVQISLLPITDEANDYAEKINKELLENNIRSSVNSKNEALGAKIRNATLQKVPFLGIIGKQEMESDSISLRSREGKDLGKVKIDSLIKKLKQEIDKKI